MPSEELPEQHGRALAQLSEAQRERAPALASIGQPAHIPELDGLRGIAVLLVFFHHAISAAGVSAPTRADKIFSSVQAAGWIGVDIFFALSGFLITGILLRTRSRPSFFTNFYAKRTLRIFPLYYLFLFFAFVVLAGPLQSLFAAGQEYRTLEHAQIWFWAYLQNWYFVGLGTGSQVPVTQLWSLAVEEQFYLLWPLVIYLFPPRRTLVLSAVLIALAPCLRYLSLRLGWSDTSIYMATHTRMDALLVGALLAGWIGLSKPLPSAKVTGAAAFLTFVGGLAVCAVLDGGLKRTGEALQVLGLTVIPASSALSILTALLAQRNNLWRRIISMSPFRMSGKYSYAMYLFHPPILWGLAAYLKGRHLLGPDFRALSANYLLFAGISLVATVLLSAFSWYAFERHFLALKRFFVAFRIATGDRPTSLPRH